MAKNQQANQDAESRDEPAAGPREYRHKVLEDCVLNGMYRTVGEIIFSNEKKLPHCSVIE
jgi:hypothetical protein